MKLSPEIPPVPLGGRLPFWCACKTTPNGPLEYMVLDYCNGHRMGISDVTGYMPTDVCPLDDDSDDGLWTGWFERGCIQCSMSWKFKGEVIAWDALDPFLLPEIRKTPTQFEPDETHPFPGPHLDRFLDRLPLDQHRCFIIHFYDFDNYVSLRHAGENGALYDSVEVIGNWQLRAALSAVRAAFITVGQECRLRAHVITECEEHEIFLSFRSDGL